MISKVYYFIFIILMFCYFLFYDLFFLVGLEEEADIQINFLMYFSENYCTKEEKYIKFLVYDKEKLWVLINNFASEYKVLHKDEIISQGFRLEPEDDKYYSFMKFSSYSNFAEFLKHKYSDTSLISDKKGKFIEFRNVLTFYTYNYTDRFLEIHDFYVFNNSICLVEADENDRKFLTNLKEVKKLEEIMIKKEGVFKEIILENKKKKKDSWFTIRTTDQELYSRLAVLNSKINAK